MKILVADHQARARQSMCALLATWWATAEIREAESGQQAARLAGEWQPDVIVLDLQMPERNGIATFEQIKARVLQARIVALSMDPSDGAPARLAGVDAFVCKCELPERLLKVLAAVINQSAGDPPAKGLSKVGEVE